MKNLDYHHSIIFDFNYFIKLSVKHKGSVLESLWGADSISVHGSGGGFWLGRNQNGTESIPSVNKYNRNIIFKIFFDNL